MNVISLIGRLGQDPEIKFFDSGKSATTFSLAVTRKFKDKDGNKPTDWFRCRAFGKTGETIAEHIKKGDMFSVSGRMENHKYIDKQGNNRDMWLLVVSEFTFIGNKNSSTNNQNIQKEVFDDIEDDDIPF